MKQYLDLLRHILDHGADRGDRTGTGTRGVFGYQMRFDLREGFPLLTTKKLFTKAIVHELLWMLRGETHVAPLQAVGVKIWDEWATEAQTARFGRKAGDLGPIYGHQWRSFGKDRWIGIDGVDQIAKVIRDIRETPNSRRLIVSAWNPAEAEKVALPPCHTMFQFYVQDGVLSCQLYQRSADCFLGLPFNIVSYALLTSMVAHVSGLVPGDFVHTLGDAHLYRNHLDQARLQIERAPRPLPKLALNPLVKHIDGFSFEDVIIEGYDPHPHIPGAVSV